MGTIDRKIYSFCRTYVSDDVRERIKRFKFHIDNRFNFIRTYMHGTFNTNELKELLKSVLQDDFEILMVHSSFNQMVPNYTGTVTELLTMLLEICGKNRTLAMPAFCFQLPKEFDAVKQREIDTFHISRTPSKMGILTEVFRRYKGVKRSLHPTVSVCAVGPLSDEMVNDHFFGSDFLGYGYGTPFDKMRQHKTAILGLGVQYYRSLTQVHTAESMLGDEYPLKLKTDSVDVKLIDYDNKAHYSRHIFYNDDRTTNRSHDVMLPYLTPDEFTEWKFHGVTFYRAKATAITRAVMAAAKDGKTIYDHK
ncbi:MAG: AAC(3) family N-acetyltransferase [Chitinivibrionales bacterium]|nr:AAC(3) family N-acetyltransferase [Chitinivibrionales bacterium]